MNRYDPFDGLYLPDIRPRQASAPRKQPMQPSYAPQQEPEPTIFRYDPMAQPSRKPRDPQPDVFRWDPLGWRPGKPVDPEPTIFRWDPNAQPQPQPRPQPPQPRPPGNGAAYTRPNVDRFGPRPRY